MNKSNDPPIGIDISDPKIYASPYYQKLQLARHRYLIAYGSRDSAKSYSIAQKVIANVLEEPYAKVVLVRKIGNDIRDSQFQTILDVVDSYGLNELFWHTSTNLRIKRLGSNNMILSRGLDKPTRLKSIKDPTIVWVEEANEITQKDFENINMSIRGPEGCLKQIILSFNPDDEDCWINDYFFPPKESYEREDGNFHLITPNHRSTLILHTTYRDNRFCTDDRKQVYEDVKIKNPIYYRTAVNGLWGGGKTGRIFENVNYVQDFPEVWERKFHGYGLDFGFANHPSALIECCLSHGEIYVRELLYRTGLVNTERIKGQLSLQSEFQRLEVQKHEKIIADSAEPKSIAELNSVGYTVIGAKKYKGSVEASINQLCNYRINIVGGSPNLKKEQKNYCYEMDKNGKPTNKPIDAYNHCWDAIRYWFQEFLLKGNTIAQVF